MNKKVSTILTLSLMLGGSLLSSSAFAEEFPLADKPLASVANGDEVVFYQKGSSSERILGVVVDNKGVKSIDVIDATAKNFKKADINNYKWQVVVGQSTTKKTIYSFVNVATKDTLAFDNQDKPIFTDKDAKVYATHDGKYQFYYTDGQINYDGTDQHRFLSATDLDATKTKKAIYVEKNSARLEGTDFSKIQTYLYDTTPDAVDDEELNGMWYGFVQQIRNSSGAHPLLSGYAARILYDKGRISREEMRDTLSFYSSVGNAPSDIAYWFEGFLRASGSVLLLDDNLWQLVNGWLCGLSDGNFIELLPVIRRTFSNFTTAERRKLGEKAKGFELNGTDTGTAVGNNSCNDEDASKVIPLLGKLLGIG